MSAPLYWAKFVSGNADRITRRNLTRAQLDRLRESTAQHVEWGVEPKEQAIEAKPEHL